LFQGIRWLFDWSLGLLPIPAFYLFWLGVLGYWVYQIKNRSSQNKWGHFFKYWIMKLIAFAALVYSLFIWLWGFNYARVPLVKQIGLEVQPLDTAQLWREFEFETRELTALRHTLLGKDTNAINDTRFWPKHAEDTIRAAVKTCLSEMGIPVTSKVRGRVIWPAGTLYKFGAAGLYWPFVGEGNLEAGLHPLQKLPVMAHEMTHGYGMADEGICNFIAYVACYNHLNPYIAYCARLDFWRDLAVNCKNSDPERFIKSVIPTIDRGIIADEMAIQQQQDKYDELAPALRYQVYDNYLKAQGIEQGMLNYDEVLMLVHAWRQKKGPLPILQER
jgi:hypothetical protein